MEQITSSSNPRLKHLALLATKATERQKSHSFVVEGTRLIEDTPPQYIEEIYFSQSYFEKIKGTIYFHENRYKDPQENVKVKNENIEVNEENYQPIKTFLLPDHLFRKISTTQTPQGILAVVRQPAWEWEDLLKPGTPLLLILEDIQDPGNLGTMFRTAEAAGATGVIMTRGCVDLFNPKTVRATMSSVFRVPFRVTGDMIETLQQLQHRQIRTYAAYLDQDSQAESPCFYDTCDYRPGTAFLIGNEGNGLHKETADAATQKILIPMEGQIESLNAAMSAGILLYEAHRQRHSSR